MKMIRLVAAYLSVALASSAIAGVTSMGDRTCGKWVADKPNNLHSASDQTWLVGYLTGLAVATQTDILVSPDLESLVLWMDNWCRANPLSTVSVGGTQLYNELKDHMPRRH
jgi:hypothetical protein